jgi:hypothetical protein
MYNYNNADTIGSVFHLFSNSEFSKNRTPNPFKDSDFEDEPNDLNQDNESENDTNQNNMHDLSNGNALKVSDHDTIQFQTLVNRSKNSSKIVDQKMFAIQQLVGQLHSELKRNAKFTSYPQAKDFVDEHNKTYEKNGTKKAWSILKYQDYDGDNVPDVIVGYKNKLYSYNGFRPKETDYPLRQAFYVHDPYEKYQRSKVS